MEFLIIILPRLPCFLLQIVLSFLRFTLGLNFPHVRDVLSPATNAKLPSSDCAAGDLEQFYIEYKVYHLQRNMNNTMLLL